MHLSFPFYLKKFSSHIGKGILGYFPYSKVNDKHLKNLIELKSTPLTAQLILE